MPEAVYCLCALTSVLCAGLLIRSYRANRSKMLLWSTLCFIGLAINNILLVVDLVITGPSVDLQWLRSLAAGIAFVTLLIGLIWESR